MAKVKIKIEVNPNADDEELGNIQNQVNNTPSLENVSNVSVKIRGDGIYEEIPSNSSGINGLSLGYALVFDENGYLDNADLEGGVLESTENPVEFVWGVVPQNGEYTVRLTFTDAQSLKDITIFGDSEVNQFPTRAIIDGYKEITNDDLTWYINFGNEASTHTIEFTHWNKVNYNACLSKIGITLQYIEIDKTSGLKSVDSTSQSSTDTTGIFYGTVENRGSLEILDKTGELVDMLKDGIIDNSNTKIEIVANNESVQTHISTDSTYNANSKIMSLDLGNRLNSLDILKYKGYNYPDHSERLSVLFFDVLSNLRYALFGKDKELTEEEFKEMLSAKYDVKDTLYDYLYSINIEYPVIEPNRTYREVIDEICTIAQMQMYITDEDNVYFVSARPKNFDEDAVKIHIPKKNMFSQLDYSVVLKNKYDGIEIGLNKVNDSREYDTVVTEINGDLSNYDYANHIVDNEKLMQNINYNMNNFTTTISASYVKLDTFYVTGEIKINKKNNSNLVQILKILNKIKSDDGVYYIDVNYDNIKYNISSKMIYNINGSLDASKWTIDRFENYTQNLIETTSHSSYFENTISKEITNSKAEYSRNDESYISSVYDENKEEFTITYKVQVGQNRIKMGYSGLIPTDGDYLTMEGELETLIPKSVTISVYGNKRIISFEQVQESTANIESAKTKVSLPSSGTLLQTNTRFYPNVISLDSLEDWEYFDYVEYIGYTPPAFTVPISNNDNFFGIKYNGVVVGATRQWTTMFNGDGILSDGWFGNYLPYTSLRYPSDYYNGDFKALFNQLIPILPNYVTSNSSEEFEKFKKLDGKILYIKSSDSYAKITIKDAEMISHDITQSKMPELFNIFASEIPKGNDGSFSHFLKGYKINLTFFAPIYFKLSTIISDNILSDYKNGVSSGKVTISCNDYYDSNGERIINWANGQIPKANEIVYFDNDLYSDGEQRYWKIKGRTFRKVGVPMIDLELEEVIK